MFEEWIYKLRLFFVNKERLLQLDRKYIYKVLKFYKVNNVVIENSELKYKRVFTYYRSIKAYSDFMESTFLDTDILENPDRKLLEKNELYLYFTDLFIDSNMLVNVDSELKRFISIYINLVDMLNRIDISDSGSSFLVFKLLDKYLSNMEKILVQLIFFDIKTSL